MRTNQSIYGINDRKLVISHGNDGSIVSDFEFQISKGKKYTYFSPLDEELKKDLEGKILPKIQIITESHVDDLPEITNDATRIIVLDSTTISNINIKANPSHIILIYTELTQIDETEIAKFSYAKKVSQDLEIQEVCYEVYFDMKMYYQNKLEHRYSGQNNKLFNNLKIKFVEKKFNVKLNNQTYVSIFHYASGKNLSERVHSGIELWNDFVKFLELQDNHDTLYPSINFDDGYDFVKITDHINDMSNEAHLNAIVEDVFKNHPFAQQLSKTKITYELRLRYSYPCYLVRIVKKPKNTSVRTKLANLMSMNKFKCGRIKIVSQKNLTKFEKYYEYLHIYKLK